MPPRRGLGKPRAPPPPGAHPERRLPPAAKPSVFAPAPGAPTHSILQQRER